MNNSFWNYRVYHSAIRAFNTDKGQYKSFPRFRNFKIILVLKFKWCATLVIILIIDDINSITVLPVRHLSFCIGSLKGFESLTWDWPRSDLFRYFHPTRLDEIFGYHKELLYQLSYRDIVILQSIRELNPLRTPWQGDILTVWPMDYNKTDFGGSGPPKVAHPMFHIKINLVPQVGLEPTHPLLNTGF